MCIRDRPQTAHSRPQPHCWRGPAQDRAALDPCRAGRGVRRPRAHPHLRRRDFSAGDAAEALRGYARQGLGGRAARGQAGRGLKARAGQLPAPQRRGRGLSLIHI